MNETDTKPMRGDIILCLNTICSNKCGRYYKNWRVADMQSYINPVIEYDEFGNQKECKLRKNWETEK